MGSGQSRDGDAESDPTPFAGEGTDQTLAAPIGTQDTLASATGATLASGADATLGSGVAETLASTDTLASVDPGSPAARLGSFQDLPIVEAGRYEILREVGRGGLGRILEARDRRTGRLVAIKELLAETERKGAELLDRLAREALITANLEHPAIVPVHEVARWASGQPFYVMKLVRGRSLADVVADATTLERRLALVPHVVQVAEALAYAHSQGWIHRDLKPANVLIGGFGETVVIDWGLARQIAKVDIRISVRPAMSRPGQIVGTPVYMAPEQARGVAVDARTDVYAVGAMLYHVLAGVAPYAEHRTAVAVIERVAKSEPPRALTELAPGAPRDLLAIVARAMEANPVDRYPTAGELAADLERFQTGALVAAHSYTRWERVRRFVRRNRAAVAIAALAFTALAAIGTVAVVRIVRAERAAQADRVTAMAARDEAEAQRAEAVLRLSGQYRELGRAQLLEQSVGRALPYLAAALRGNPDDPVLRLLAGRAAASGGARFVGGFDLPITGVAGVGVSADGTAVISHNRGSERWDLLRGVRTAVYAAPGGTQSAAGDVAAVWNAGDRQDEVFETRTGTIRGRVDPGGDLVAHGFVYDDGSLWTVSRTGEIRFWNPADLSRTATVIVPGAPDVTAVTTTDNGKRWAVGGADGRVWIGDRSGVVRTVGAPNSGKVYILTFGVGDAYLVGVSWDNTLRVWDAATARQTVLIELGGALVTVATGTDPPRLLTSVPEGLPTLYELPTGRKLRTYPAENVNVARLDDDAERILMGDGGGRVSVWDTATGAELSRLFGHHGEVVSIDRFDLHDRYITATSTGSIRLWDLTHTDAVAVSRHANRVWNGRFLDDRTVITVGGDGLGRIADVDGKQLGVLTGHGDAATWVTLSADGQQIATSGRDSTARIWRRDGTAIATLAGHGAKVRSVEISPAGDEAVTASFDKTVRIWRLADRSVRRQLDLAVPAMGARYSPDGSVIAIAAEEPAFTLVDPATGAITARVPFRTGIAVEPVFSPDGELVTAVGTTPEVVMVRAATGDKVFSIEVSSFVTTLVWTPDGRELAIGNADGSIVIYDRNGTPLRSMRDPSPVVSLAFRPDGRILASGGRDGVVHLWDRTTGDELDRWHAGDEVYYLRFSPDGTRLLIMGLMDAALVWNIGPWQGTPDELDAIQRCSAYRIDNDHLVETMVDAAACRPRAPHAP